jgi:hypothetical protein
MLTGFISGSRGFNQILLVQVLGILTDYLQSLCGSLD